VRDSSLNGTPPPGFAGDPLPLAPIVVREGRFLAQFAHGAIDALAVRVFDLADRFVAQPCRCGHRHVRGVLRAPVCEMPNSGEIRDVKSRDLSAYVKEVMGPEFTPKDFRTWAGTLIAAVKLAELGATEDLEQAEKNVLEAVDDVARRLGNTRDIARASYISPRVIHHYLEGSVVEYHVEQLEEIIAAEQEDLTEAEMALLKLLKRKLRREIRKAG
jgi:Eukaryotic DNA topoisomerase I, catalytic core